MTIKSRMAQVITEALTYRVICIFSPTKLLILDKDSAFTGDIIHLILQAINCQLKTISPFNHHSLKIKRQIQTVGKNINIPFDWKRWDMALICSCCGLYDEYFCHSLTLSGFSLFELVSVQKPPDLHNCTFLSLQHVSSSHNVYQLPTDKAEFIVGIMPDYKTHLE